MLLDRARRVSSADPELRRLAALAGGSRARWLAGLNLDWAFVAAHTRPGDDAWRLGDAGQRRGYLAALRAQDPDAARELIAASWDAAGPERVMFLSVLADRLSPADEPMLEAALGDRGPGRARLGRVPARRLPDPLSPSGWPSTPSAGCGWNTVSTAPAW